MSSQRPKPATLADLARVEGQAELIAGRIVRFKPAGYLPGRIAAEIFFSLATHTEATGRGEAVTSTLAFAVPKLASGRESFSPDASCYLGPLPQDEMDFIAGPPTLAVEVRGDDDYGPAAEAEMAAKRADYFEAGTRVVWDVDTLSEVIHAYRHDNPSRPRTFARCDMADAEPAVPGWRMAVEEMFA